MIPLDLQGALIQGTTTLKHSETLPQITMLNEETLFCAWPKSLYELLQKSLSPACHKTHFIASQQHCEPEKEECYTTVSWSKSWRISFPPYSADVCGLFLLIFDLVYKSSATNINVRFGGGEDGYSSAADCIAATILCIQRLRVKVSLIACTDSPVLRVEG